MIIESEKKPIENLMCGAYESIKGLVSADTVVGNPIKTENGAVIIPISKVVMGFVTGGGEYGGKNVSQNENQYAGGSGAGMSVSPVAFLVSDGSTISLVNINDKSAFDKIVDAVPELIKIVVNAIK